MITVDDGGGDNNGNGADGNSDGNKTKIMKTRYKSVLQHVHASVVGRVIILVLVWGVSYHSQAVFIKER